MAHAAWAGHGRTLCGTYATAEELSWPARLYCATCLEAADEGRTLGLVAPHESLPDRRTRR